MKKILLIPFLLCALSAQAQDRCAGQREDEVLLCYQLYGSKLKEKIDEADHDLSQLPYAEARRRYIESQKLWAEFVEKDCAFDTAPIAAEQSERRALAMVKCRYQRYEQRLQQMRRFIEAWEANA